MQIINLYDAEKQPCAADDLTYWLHYPALTLWSESTSLEKKHDLRTVEMAVKCVFKSSITGFSFILFPASENNTAHQGTLYYQSVS